MKRKPYKTRGSRLRSKQFNWVNQEEWVKINLPPTAITQCLNCHKYISKYWSIYATESYPDLYCGLCRVTHLPKD